MKPKYFISKNYRPDVEKALKENNGYCPCQPVSEDSKCICKMFRDAEEGTCICGLYTKSTRITVYRGEYDGRGLLEDDGLDLISDKENKNYE